MNHYTCNEEKKNLLHVTRRCIWQNEHDFLGIVKSVHKWYIVLCRRSDTPVECVWERSVRTGSPVTGQTALAGDIQHTVECERC